MEPLLNRSKLWREDHVAGDAANSGHGNVLCVCVLHHPQTEGEILNNVCVSRGCGKERSTMKVDR